ncbi:MAG: ATP-binding protein [Bacteroidota bacterium]|nr:ATP-binding protein [Bacteroidota bacterium]
MTEIDLRSDSPRSKDHLKIIFDVDDRGKARYFHGRQTVIESFDRLRRSASERGNGTIFVVQGAPGAGKTALLHVLKARARKDRWRVGTINPSALGDPVEMADSLGVRLKRHIRSHIEGGFQGVKAGLTSTRPAKESVRHVLKSASRFKRGVLLVLDEAQTIAWEAEQRTVLYTLNSILNGEWNRPAILLAGGLSTTRQAFQTLGISRLRGDCLVNLARLNADAERAVIRDWLVKAGRAKGEVAEWIDAIASETDGWPQHIVSFAEPASQLLRATNGVPTAQGLSAVISEGVRRKNQYYYGRMDGVSRKNRTALAGFLRGRPPDAAFTREEVWSVLESANPPEEVVMMFEAFLRKGILAWTRDADLAVPIPSMRRWLVSTYGP